MYYSQAACSVAVASQPAPAPDVLWVMYRRLVTILPGHKAFMRCQHLIDTIPVVAILAGPPPCRLTDPAEEPSALTMQKQYS